MGTFVMSPWCLNLHVEQANLSLPDQMKSSDSSVSYKAVCLLSGEKILLRNKATRSDFYSRNSYSSEWCIPSQNEHNVRLLLRKKSSSSFHSDWCRHGFLKCTQWICTFSYAINWYHPMHTQTTRIQFREGFDVEWFDIEGLKTTGVTCIWCDVPEDIINFSPPCTLRIVRLPPAPPHPLPKTEVCSQA